MVLHISPEEIMADCLNLINLKFQGAILMLPGHEECLILLTEANLRFLSRF